MSVLGMLGEYLSDIFVTKCKLAIILDESWNSEAHGRTFWEEPMQECTSSSETLLNVVC